MGEGSSVVTAMALVIAMVRVWSLVLELPHAVDAAKIKKKRKLTYPSDEDWLNYELFIKWNPEQSQMGVIINSILNNNLQDRFLTGKQNVEQCK